MAEEDPLLLQQHPPPLVGVGHLSGYGTGLAPSTPIVRSPLEKVAHHLRRASRLGYGIVRKFTQVYGPGMVVMLADIDAGSLVTSAQTGKEWGYATLIWQVVLIAPLFMVQELTVRLGAATGKGHGELIRKHFGTFWAWVSIACLTVTCTGAVVTEMIAVAGLSEITGIPPRLAIATVVVVFIFVVLTGSSKRVERVCLCLGMCELVFCVSMLMARPSPKEVIAGVTQSVDFNNKSFLYIMAANVGSVIAPWMIFYEQSAVCDKQLKPAEVPLGRRDTLIGAILCQFIVCCVIMTTAATVWDKEYSHVNPAGFRSIPEVSAALSPHLGRGIGSFLVHIGFFGSALNAALVISVTAVWGFAEVSGLKTGRESFLQQTPAEQPCQYILFALLLIAGAILALTGIDLVSLNIAVNVLNTILLPLVLGFLLLLSSDPNILPDELRLQGGELILYSSVILIVSVGGLLTAAISFSPFGGPVGPPE